jgi:hypothetical protein
MLTAEATCADITMKDRAMIAGIHHLAYGSARVELALNAAERDRFIMWSAPLKSMYSGDYHFEDAANNPKWGDVYMNLFQHASPAGNSSAGIANSFTATFGDLDVSLLLGKAFNLKMTSTTANKDKPFAFPQTASTYTDVKTATYNVPRAQGNRFILDKDDGDPHALPVFNDVDGSYLAQVVNPYLAYLNVELFLQGNQSCLSDLGYVIWDGSTSSFTPHVAVGNIDNRFEITTVPSMSDPSGFIPPLQSFFVQKKESAPLGTDAITISALWTTTSIPGGTPYKLRANAPETNILRIKAVQDKRVSYAVLHYNESTSPAYNSKEDMHKLFYQLEENVIPLEVYTFAPTREVLAIHSSSDFSQNIPLGLRTDKAGSVTLEFSGMATFGHNVYLIDHAQSNKETDLQKNPTYTFTATKKSAGDKVIELNDRFSLRTTYTGIGLGNEVTGNATDVNVSSRDGYIYVQSPFPVSILQVYNLAGALVYSSTAQSDYFRIQIGGQQAYIVKATMNDQYSIKKVFVR